ncbi:hypothetical protein Aduo_013056 [Ancylostoma duodenale]
MEVVVLRALKKARATHCCDILDSGRALGFNFIIMTLVGASLMIELTSGELPWKNLEDTVAICNAKEKSRTSAAPVSVEQTPKVH